MTTTGGSPMIKLVFMVKRREGMTREEFQRYWREEHAELVKRHAELLRIRRYMQTHARDTDLDHAISGSRGSEPREYDGVAELWWDSIDDLVQAATSEEGQAAQQALLEDERRFIDVANSPIWLGEEILVMGASQGRSISPSRP
ncbi:MAG TPA: EthD domain-containing protein [Solirubrobacteraceae bacterium]|nr:EthD domain-containing protein [Solirubrobacteraceae bacterium]